MLATLLDHRAVGHHGRSTCVEPLSEHLLGSRGGTEVCRRCLRARSAEWVWRPSAGRSSPAGDPRAQRSSRTLHSRRRPPSLHAEWSPAPNPRRGPSPSRRGCAGAVTDPANGRRGRRGRASCRTPACRPPAARPSSRDPVALLEVGAPERMHEVVRGVDPVQCSFSIAAALGGVRLRPADTVSPFRGDDERSRATSWCSASTGTSARPTVPVAPRTATLIARASRRRRWKYRRPSATWIRDWTGAYSTPSRGRNPSTADVTATASYSLLAEPERPDRRTSQQSAANRVPDR